MQRNRIHFKLWATVAAVLILGATDPDSGSLADSEASGAKRTEQEPQQEGKAPEKGKGKKNIRIVVVVSEDNPIKSLTLAQLRRVFLRQQTQWSNGWKISVYERPVVSPIRVSFSSRLHRKKPTELREYWLNLKLTRGLKPPKVLRSTKLIKLYLQRVKGGICYMYEDEIDDTVKVLDVEGL